MESAAMSDMEIVQRIYAVGGTAIIAGFLLAVTTTGARVLFYLRHGKPRPRLLNRDIVTKGGMAVTIVLITVIRFYPPNVRVALTAGNIGWALITTGAAVIAIWAYNYYELFVIKRKRPDDADDRVAG